MHFSKEDLKLANRNGKIPSFRLMQVASLLVLACVALLEQSSQLLVGSVGLVNAKFV